MGKNILLYINRTLENRNNKFRVNKEFNINTQLCLDHQVLTLCQILILCQIESEKISCDRRTYSSDSIKLYTQFIPARAWRWWAWRRRAGSVARRARLLQRRPPLTPRPQARSRQPSLACPLPKQVWIYYNKNNWILIGNVMEPEGYYKVIPTHTPRKSLERKWSSLKVLISAQLFSCYTISFRSSLLESLE